jgi:hypothetical protein
VEINTGVLTKYCRGRLLLYCVIFIEVVVVSQISAKLKKRKIKNVKSRRDVKRKRARKSEKKTEAIQYFKYLDVKGATLTLQNKTFRHAKPSSFNDSEDLTSGGVFLNSDRALTILPNAFIDMLASNLNLVPTCASPMRKTVQKMQQAILSNPDIVDIIKSENSQKSIPGGAEYYNNLMADHVREINKVMQSYRILCVTTSSRSEHMWKKYAENHKGIVLRIEPNRQKDSKFTLFRPVEYLAQRPPLYQSVEEFVFGSVFGDNTSRYKIMCEKIIFSKTLDWEGEDEYRLAVPIINEIPWETLPYHKEELADLYLGLDMGSKEIIEIVNLARRVNPHINVYSMERLSNGELCCVHYCE